MLGTEYEKPKAFTFYLYQQKLAGRPLVDFGSMLNNLYHQQQLSVATFVLNAKNWSQFTAY